MGTLCDCRGAWGGAWVRYVTGGAWGGTWGGAWVRYVTGGAWGEKCYCSMDAKPHSMMMKSHMQLCKPQLFDTTHIITGTSASLPFEVQVYVH